MQHKSTKFVSRIKLARGVKGKEDGNRKRFGCNYPIEDGNALLTMGG